MSEWLREGNSIGRTFWVFSGALDDLNVTLIWFIYAMSYLIIQLKWRKKKRKHSAKLKLKHFPEASVNLWPFTIQVHSEDLFHRAWRSSDGLFLFFLHLHPSVSQNIQIHSLSFLTVTDPYSFVTIKSAFMFFNE